MRETTPLVVVSAVLLLASAAQGAFKFTAWADNRPRYSDARSRFLHVIEQMDSILGSNYWLHVVPGDYDDENGGPAETDACLRDNALVTGWSRICGNHDTADLGMTNYVEDYDNARLIFINEYQCPAGNHDCSAGRVCEDIRMWIADQLVDAPPFVFVVGHEPAYPQNRHVGDSLDYFSAERDAFWQLLNDHGVLAYICGHTHYYSTYSNSMGSTVQIDAGNAGNPGEDEQTFVLFDATDNGYVDVTAYSGVEGEAFSERDTFRLEPPMPDTTAPVISNVAATEVSDNAATITWQTDEPADSRVDYGLDSSYGQVASDTTRVTTHSINLTGLQPETTYHYAVTSADAAGNSASSTDLTFTTPAGNHAPVATDDAYSTDEDTKLDVSAPGVLANDTDADNDALSATIVSGASSGSVALNSDGSFTYTPKPNVYGIDSFTYQATDGSATSNTATVTITINSVNDPPSAPANLTAVAGFQMVDLNWDASTDPEGDAISYWIYRATSQDGTYSVLDTTTATSYSDGSVINETTYWYKVSAVDAALLESGYSNMVSATPTDSAYDAYAVSASILGGVGKELETSDGLNGTVAADDGLTMDFGEMPNGSAGASGLEVEIVLQSAADKSYDTINRMTLYLSASWTGYDGGSDPLEVWIREPGGNLSDISGVLANGSVALDPALHIDSAGKVAVILKDAGPLAKESKDELYVDLLYTDVIVGEPDTDPPAAPTDVAVSGYDLTATVTWSAVTATDLAGYRVYRRTDATDYTCLTPTAVVTDTVSSDFTEVAEGGTYYYAVTAEDTSGNESAFSSEKAVTLTDMPPAGPTLSVSGGERQVQLTWTMEPEEMDDIAGYDVYRDYVQVNTGLVTETSYLDQNLDAGTYTYHVVAVEVTGLESEPSNAIEATVKDEPPAAPLNLMAESGDAMVSLNWDDNSESDLAGYNVYRLDPGASDYSLINAGLVTSSAFTDTGLVNGQTYSYKVTAVDTAEQESVASNVVSATPVRVAGLSITVIDPDYGTWGTSPTVMVSGSGFVDGLSLTFENGVGPDPKASIVSVEPDSIEAVIEIKVGGPSKITDRPWDVRVTNPDGSTAVLMEGFTVRTY